LHDNEWPAGLLEGEARRKGFREIATATGPQFSQEGFGIQCECRVRVRSVELVPFGTFPL
jgi:hypothetical protein